MATSGARKGAAPQAYALWDSPGYLVWQASMRWQREIAAALKPLGLTHVQFVVLASAMALGGEGRPPNQRQVAERAGTDVMMTSQILRVLEDRGLLNRLLDAADSRVRRVRLSSNGRRALAKAIVAVENVDRALFSDARATAAFNDIRRVGGIARRPAGVRG